MTMTSKGARAAEPTLESLQESLDSLRADLEKHIRECSSGSSLEQALRGPSVEINFPLAPGKPKA